MIAHIFYKRDHRPDAALGEAGGVRHAGGAAHRLDALPPARQVGDLDRDPLFGQPVALVGVQPVDSGLLPDPLVLDLAGLPVDDPDRFAVVQQHVGDREHLHRPHLRDALQLERLERLVHLADVLGRDALDGCVSLARQESLHQRLDPSLAVLGAQLDRVVRVGVPQQRHPLVAAFDPPRRGPHARPVALPGLFRQPLAVHLPARPDRVQRARRHLVDHRPDPGLDPGHLLQPPHRAHHRVVGFAHAPRPIIVQVILPLAPFERLVAADRPAKRCPAVDRHLVAGVPVERFFEYLQGDPVEVGDIIGAHGCLP